MHTMSSTVCQFASATLGGKKFPFMATKWQRIIATVNID